MKKKKTKGYQFKYTNIYDEMFGVSLLVLVGKDFVKLSDALKEFYSQDFYFDYDKLIKCDAYYTVLEIGTQEKNVIFVKTLKNYSGIAHELIHLSWYVAEQKGLRLDTDKGELQAYFVSSYIDRVLQADYAEDLLED